MLRSTFVCVGDCPVQDSTDSPGPGKPQVVGEVLQAGLHVVSEAQGHCVRKCCWSAHRFVPCHRTGITDTEMAVEVCIRRRCAETECAEGPGVRTTEKNRSAGFGGFVRVSVQKNPPMKAVRFQEVAKVGGFGGFLLGLIMIFIDSPFSVLTHYYCYTHRRPKRNPQNPANPARHSRINKLQERVSHHCQ